MMASSAKALPASHGPPVGPGTIKDKHVASLQQSNGQGSDAAAVENGIAFWTEHTRPVLESLLGAIGNYTPEQQLSHLAFLDDFIVPTMGRAPDEAHSRSMLTENGSPFETSLNYSDKGTPTLRFCYEPVFPGYDGVTEDPVTKLANEVGADLRWFNQFAADFFPSKEDEASMVDKVPRDAFRIPKVFLAFDLVGSQRAMKAYFYPVVKYMTSKNNSDRATFDLIRRLDPLGPLFGPALDMIEAYQKLLYQDPPLTVVVGIDCANPDDGDARVKIYIDPQSNTWDAVRQHVTLGGARTDETTMQGLAILRDMWNLVIGEPDDADVDDSFSKTPRPMKLKSSGACFSWELRPGQAYPDVKIYVPLNQYFGSDAAVVQALEKVFAKRGWAWGEEGAYRKIVSDAYGSDVVDKEVDTPVVHTFISFSFSEKKGAYMTTYVAPFVHRP